MSFTAATYDFFDAATYPLMSHRSLRWPSGDRYVVEGDLTLHGVTRDVGSNTNLPMDGGGAVVGDNVQIGLETEAILQRARTEMP